MAGKRFENLPKTGVKAEEIRKGMILVVKGYLEGMLRSFPYTNPRKNAEKLKKKQWKCNKNHKKKIVFLMFP